MSLCSGRIWHRNQRDLYVNLSLDQPVLTFAKSIRKPTHCTSHIATAMTWGYGTQAPVFQLHYKQTLGIPASQLSWIGCTELFLFWILSVFSGRLSELAYTRHLYIISFPLNVFGMVMTSLPIKRWHIVLAQGFIVGIGGGLMFLPVVASARAYFRGKRTLAVAISSCGSSIGAILFPAAIHYLIPIIGFAWAVRVCAFISLAACIIGCSLLHPRNLQKHQGQYCVGVRLKLHLSVHFLWAHSAIYFALFTMLIYVSSHCRTLSNATWAD